MRFTIGALLSLSLTAGSALAADLPPRTQAPYMPPPAPALPFYFGLFGGGAFGDSETTFGGKNTFCFPGHSSVGEVCESAGATGLASNSANHGSTGASDARAKSSNHGSVFGGLKFGADVAVSQSLVLGAVADFTFVRLKKSSLYEYTNFSQPLLFGEDEGVRSSTLKTNWVATLRARLGVKTSDRVLLFASGGLAFVDIGASVRNQYDVVDALSPDRPSLLAGGPVVQRGSTSGVAIGYALGAGVEYAFTRNVGLSFEYLYYSASKSYKVSQTSGSTLGQPAFRAKAKPSGHLVRIGVDYRL